MSLEKVQLGLISLYQTLTPEIPTAWDNRKFDPVRDSLWASVHFMPAGEEMATLGQGGTDLNFGILQINLNIPLGIGEKNTREKISSLRTCFSPRTLLHEDQAFTIVRRYPENGRAVDNFWRIPFTVHWKAYIPRL